MGREIIREVRVPVERQRTHVDLETSWELNRFEPGSASIALEEHNVSRQMTMESPEAPVLEQTDSASPKGRSRHASCINPKQNAILERMENNTNGIAAVIMKRKMIARAKEQRRSELIQAQKDAINKQTKEEYLAKSPLARFKRNSMMKAKKEVSPEEE